MIARMIRTSHAKNSTIPGMAYPLIVLALATTASYPPVTDLIGRLTGTYGPKVGCLPAVAQGTVRIGLWCWKPSGSPAFSAWAREFRP